MRLFKAIASYFDQRREIDQMYSQISGLLTAKREAEHRAKFHADNAEALQKRLNKAEADVKQLTESAFLTPHQVTELNAKIDDLNTSLRAIADADKIIAGAEVVTRYIRGEKP